MYWEASCLKNRICASVKKGNQSSLPIGVCGVWKAGPVEGAGSRRRVGKHLIIDLLSSSYKTLFFFFPREKYPVSVLASVVPRS